MSKVINRLVLAIKSIETDETLERWQFDIKTDEESLSAANGGAAPIPGAPVKAGKQKEKTEKEVQAEIREIIKQITSSVTFLPMLEEPCEPVISPDRVMLTAQVHSRCSHTQTTRQKSLFQPLGAMPILISLTEARWSRCDCGVSTRTTMRSRYVLNCTLTSLIRAGNGGIPRGRIKASEWRRTLTWQAQGSLCIPQTGRL